MNSQASLVSQQVTIQQWADQIRDCKNRPSDMSVETWCKNHGITKTCYYYRLRRVRETILDNTDLSDHSFVPIPYEKPENTSSILQQSDTVAEIQIPNGPCIRLKNNASEHFLHNLMEAIHHVK